eukprot:4458476-Amphidinium_carterae.1
MTVGGPFASQSAVCYLGYECPIPGIQGLNLRRGDRMVVKVGCTSDEILEGSPPFELTWNASAQNETQAKDLIDLSIVNFDTPTAYTVEMDSGNYRMCWCPASALCDQEILFVIDVGLMVIGGPTGGQTGWVCVPGFNCVLGGSLGNEDVRGVGLANSDFLMVLDMLDGDGCGGTQAFALPGFPNNGVSQPATEFGRAAQWSPEVAASTTP